MFPCSKQLSSHGFLPQINQEYFFKSYSRYSALFVYPDKTYDFCCSLNSDSSSDLSYDISFLVSLGFSQRSQEVC